MDIASAKVIAPFRYRSQNYKPRVNSIWCDSAAHAERESIFFQDGLSQVHFNRPRSQTEFRGNQNPRTNRVQGQLEFKVGWSWRSTGIDLFGEFLGKNQSYDLQKKVQRHHEHLYYR